MISRSCLHLTKHMFKLFILEYICQVVGSENNKVKWVHIIVDVYGDDNVIFELVTQQCVVVFTDDKCTSFSEKYSLSRRSIE